MWQISDQFNQSRWWRKECSSYVETKIWADVRQRKSNSSKPCSKLKWEPEMIPGQSYPASSLLCGLRPVAQASPPSPKQQCRGRILLVIRSLPPTFTRQNLEIYASWDTKQKSDWSNMPHQYHSLAVQCKRDRVVWIHHLLEKGGLVQPILAKHSKHFWRKSIRTAQKYGHGHVYGI